MIRLDDPTRPPDARILESPGGFAWWYVEVLDEDGNGVVLIWSFGLPFLPGYADAARKARPQTPASRPSLNLAVYEGGRPALYLLHEFDPGSATWDGLGQWQFGRSTIREELEDGRRWLEVALDCDLPGEREALRAEIRVAGPVPRLPPEGQRGRLFDGGARAGSTHAWTPLMGTAFGTARVQVGDGYRFAMCGRAYCDRNTSEVPLHDLGIRRWVWGHAAVGGAERIFYGLWPTSESEGPVTVGVELQRDGRVEIRDDLLLCMSPDRHTRYGMTTWDELRLQEAGSGADWLRMPLAHRVDDGPFYLRYLLAPRAAQTAGEPDRGVDAAPAVGSAEIIAPSRVDLGRHRPLVRMRVRSDQRRNSIWLPLFQGRTQGRFKRLLRGWAGSASERSPVPHAPGCGCCTGDGSRRGLAAGVRP